MSVGRSSNGRIATLAIAALGVVFGDIGTSPLYAISACFTGAKVTVTPEHIFGVLSLVFWSLVLVILLKYVAVVLNADNKGEGGVLALTALVVRSERASPRKKLYGTLGILGASLFFADGAITPAISVLSAVKNATTACNLPSSLKSLRSMNLATELLAMSNTFSLVGAGSSATSRFILTTTAIF